MSTADSALIAPPTFRPVESSDISAEPLRSMLPTFPLMLPVIIAEPTFVSESYDCE